MNQKETLAIETETDPREDGFRPLLVEELIEDEVDNPRRRIQLGVTLLEKQKLALVNLLIVYKNLFYTDIIAHELKINPTIRLIAHKRRRFGGEKILTIRQEIGKLVETRFVRQVRFQTWASIQSW